MNSPVIHRLLLGLFVLLLFGGALFIMTFVIVPEENRDVIIQLVGGINTLAGLVIGYYFGSTARNDERSVLVKVDNTAEPGEQQP